MDVTMQLAQQPPQAPCGTGKLLTIADAAALAQISKDAMRGRVERGSVQSLMGRDHKRRIPLTELVRTGMVLAPEDFDSHANHAESMDPMGAATPGMVGATYVDTAAVQHAIDIAVRALVEKERLLLTQRAESIERDRERLETELHETRAHVSQLEHQLQAQREQPRRRWFGISRKERPGA